MPTSGFEEIRHTADWALRVRGSDLADLCRQAALGMLHLAGARPGQDRFEPRAIEIEAPDGETLLVRWLEELLYDLEIRQVVPVAMNLQTEGETRLKGTLTEAPLADMSKVIKAVTFNNLQITGTPEGVESTIVFDV
ncbi:MAG TPA: archease [Anaerolineales bacterium]|nr:archease [Anaerolineales bacterium]